LFPFIHILIIHIYHMTRFNFEMQNQLTDFDYAHLDKFCTSERISDGDVYTGVFKGG